MEKDYKWIFVKCRTRRLAMRMLQLKQQMKINANLISASLRRVTHVMQSSSGRPLLFAFAFDMSVNINYRWNDLRKSRIIVRVASTDIAGVYREFFFPMTNVHCSYRRHCCGRNNNAIYTKVPRCGNSGSAKEVLLFVSKMQITTLVATPQHDWH